MISTLSDVDFRLAASYVKESKSIAFLGGAGVSTDSGIPDFRSPDGLYNIRSKHGVSYERMLSHSYFCSHTEDFYRFYWESMVRGGAKPNKAHLALAEFEREHPDKLTVITQNIDGLHQKAGSKRVLEVHGSVERYHCLDCGRAYSLSQLKRDGVPTCSCGGLIKPDVVLYEENLDEFVLQDTIKSTEEADLLIVAGTSLRVQPIASLPYCHKKGKTVIINKEQTSFDKQADLVFRCGVSEALARILGVEL